MADQLFGLSPTMNASQNKKVVQVSMNCAMPYDNNMLSGPASQSLIGLEDRLPEPEYIKVTAKTIPSERTTFVQQGPKRRKSSISVDDLMASIKPVEDSITFPTIEWSYDDSDVDDDIQNSPKSCCDLHNDDDKIEFASWGRPYSSSSSFGKRTFGGGLIRSRGNHLSLASLVSPSITHNLRADCLKAMQTPSMTRYSLAGNHDTRDAVSLALTEAFGRDPDRQ
jgi:hypothetical protein